MELQTVTPLAAERLANVLRNTGLKFPGGPPLSLEVWRVAPDEEERPFERGTPLEAEDPIISDTSDSRCSLAVAWNWWNSVNHSDESWVDEEWSGFSRQMGT